MNQMAILSKHCRTLNKKIWGIPYYAIGPDGVKHEYEPLNPTIKLKTIQATWNTVTTDSATGEDLITYEPNITISTGDIVPFPKPGENWTFHIPKTPNPEDDPSINPDAKLVAWVMHKTKIIREDALGTARIFLVRATQKKLPC